MMMTATNRKVVDGSPPEDEFARVPGPRECAIRVNVLAALGRPGDLQRVNVLPLWGDHFRVNVITGADPTVTRIPHSYFLAADARGNIIETAPRITRLY
jgi:hypothetical protein